MLTQQSECLLDLDKHSRSEVIIQTVLKIDEVGGGLKKTFTKKSFPSEVITLVRNEDFFRKHHLRNRHKTVI